MPNKSRVLIDQAAYHIIIRGNQKQAVFNQESDYLRFLKLLKKYKNRYPAKLYAYCLMTNHVHLLIDPLDKNDLKHIMHGISLSYAKWFNYKYNKCGHLWQSRYKNFVIQKDQYLINCASYIEINPIRAQICQRPEDYPWSSYKCRILGQNNEILDNYII